MRSLPHIRDQKLDKWLSRICTEAAWYNVAWALESIAPLDGQFSSLPPEKRTPEVVRFQAEQALNYALIILDALAQGIPKPLLHLLTALEDLRLGLNSRILVTGSLAAKLPDLELSTGWHRRIRAEAAALVNFLWVTGLEETQTRAARQVARALTKGGYRPPGSTRKATVVKADTVKRWHNEARRQGSEKNAKLKVAMRVFSQLSEHSQAGFRKTADAAIRGLESRCKVYRLVDENQ